MDLRELEESFEKTFFSEKEPRCYRAPGRVNLIGEHIDYNGGHVFPCALSVGNYAAVTDREDKEIRFYSENFPESGILSCSLNSIQYKKEDSWSNYAKGVIKAFLDHGFEIPHGFDIYVKGNIPGSGLSSSAALEVLIATILNDTFSFGVSKTDIALFSQEAENKFCGRNCGIMDQFASANGKKNRALFLDCATLKFDYVPLNLKGYKIIVTNSNKPHSLVTSHYNDRRKECERALSDLQKVVSIQNLCELSKEEFQKYEYSIKDPICKRRARFAVEEEERTKKAVQALKKDDLVLFGQLINASGDGLKNDYDATCKEIDILVEEARKQEGCLGSRETGGGWGGNTISIVQEDKVASFRKNVEDAYFEKTGLHADFNPLDVGDGGKRL